jgi:hypothetical protein
LKPGYWQLDVLLADARLGAQADAHLSWLDAWGNTLRAAFSKRVLKTRAAFAVGMPLYFISAIYLV